jgi:hypothetical protein
MSKDFKAIMEVQKMTLKELADSGKLVLVEDRVTKSQCYIGGTKARPKHIAKKTDIPFMHINEVRAFFEASKMTDELDDAGFWRTVHVKRYFGGNVEEIVTPDE